MAAAGGAAITAFYMFRLWFMTFAGKPRDQHRYEHAHESPKVMTVPLVVLAVFASGRGLDDAIADVTSAGAAGAGAARRARPATRQGQLVGMTWPNEHFAHLAENHEAIVVPVTWLAFCTAVGGLRTGDGHVPVRLAATRAKSGGSSPRIYRFLRNKWWFDELYDWLFVRPAHLLSPAGGRVRPERGSTG